MNPFYFGESRRRLFGVYYPPRSEQKRRGVVLCYPTHREYIRSHRAFRQLATMLSRAGFPLLRFDYYGTGDSSGESDQATLEQWKSDVLTAVDELLELSSVKTVSLVGLRLGATLAAMVADQRAAITKLVLWDPVVSGQLYFEELRERHDRLLGHIVSTNNLGPDETGLCGFPMTAAARSDLEGLDLAAFEGYRETQVFLVTSAPSAHSESLVQGLANQGIAFDHENVPSQRVWDANTLESKLLVPTKVLERIVSWVE